MKKAQIIAATAVIAIGATAGPEIVREERLEVADPIEAEYIREFGCAVTDVVFSSESLNHESKYGSNLVIAANTPNQAEVSVLPIAFDALEPAELKEIFAHEMTHACAGPPRMFKNTWENTYGDRIVGAQGFVILAENPGKSDNLRFTLIEEGVATVLEKQIVNPAKEYAFVGYVALKRLTEELQATHKITNEQLAKMVQNSDILGFVARLSGFESAEQVTSRELFWVMRMYYDTFEEAITKYK